MYKVLIPEDIAQSGKDYLTQRGYHLKVGVPTDIESLRREVADADALIVRNTRYPKEVLEAGKRLKVVARHGTGVDNIDVEAAEAMGIWVVNGPIANINAVAEHTVGMMMALSCHILRCDERTRAGDWSYRLKMQRRELRGQVLGLVGFGRIGSMVAVKAAGLGMNVIAYDLRRPDSLPPNTEIVDSIELVIKDADYVSVHLPSTADTRGMFNYGFFSRMKPTACFINCARGDLYVEADLVRALKEGLIAGAALDVYAAEPPGDTELLKMEQVVLSQHNAGLSQESTANMSLCAAMGVDEVLSGMRPKWPVNNPSR